MEVVGRARTYEKKYRMFGSCPNNDMYVNKYGLN